MHERIRTEHCILPVRLLIRIIEIDRVILADLRDVGVTEFVHVQPRTETVLLVISNFFGAVTHRTDTKFRLRKILTRQHIHLLPSVLEAPVRIETDVDLTFATGLGSDQDHTVRTTATVDSGCGCIFQDFHRLDVRRRQPLDIAYDHTVHYVQRVVATHRRTDTADTDGSAFARLTGTTRYRHTGGSTLQGLIQTGYRRLEQLVGTDRSNGTRQVRFLHRTVTDRYHFLQLHVVRLQGYTQRTGVCHLDLRRTVTDVGYYQHIAYVRLQIKITIEICDRTG